MVVVLKAKIKKRINQSYCLSPSTIIDQSSPSPPPKHHCDILFSTKVLVKFSKTFNFILFRSSVEYVQKQVFSIICHERKSKMEMEMEIVQSSEELNQINAALTYCSQVKSRLNGALLHIRRLNAKYNDTDYMAVIRNVEAFRNQNNSAPSTPQQSHKNRLHHSTDRLSSQSTPVHSKKNSNIRRCIISKSKRKTFTSTPKQLELSHMYDCSSPSLLSNANDCDGDGNGNGDGYMESTPKRSMRDLKRNNNTITVRTLKVQRNIESILTHLQVMQKIQKRNQRQMLEQSIYQNCYNASCGSPGHLGHSSCMENSLNELISINNSGNNSTFNNSSYGNCNRTNDNPPTPKPSIKRRSVYDYQQHTLQNVQRFYATPLERMHKRLMHLNASLIRTC